MISDVGQQAYLGKAFNPIQSGDAFGHTCRMPDRTFANILQAVINDDPEITEAGLATKAGLANSTIRKIIAGTTQNPRVDTALKICKALGTTIEEFMGSPQTEEERDIARLVSQLPVHLRQKLVGYGEGLLEQEDQAPPK